METPSAWNPGTRSPSPGESPELLLGTASRTTTFPQGLVAQDSPTVSTAWKERMTVTLVRPGTVTCPPTANAI